LSGLLDESRALEPGGVATDRSTPGRTHLPRSRLRRPRSFFEIWIAALVLFGVAGRVAFYIAPFGVPDSDEAVGGLMAKDVLHGHLTAFMWGQGYGGPLETWLAAPVVGLFGPTWLGLRMIPILLTAATSVVVWRVGLRTISANGAITAAALSWFFPSTLLWKTTHFHIFYASSMLLVTLTVLQVLRLYERPSARGMFVLGLLAGVGLWQSLQLMTIIPTAIVWLVVRRREVARFLPAALAGGVIGLMPVIASNLRHDWWSHDIGQPGDTVPYIERLWRFFTTLLPMALDLRTPVTLHWFLWKPLGLGLYFVVLGGFLWLVLAQRGRARSRSPELLLAIAVVFPFVYALSPLTTFIYHAGYVVVLMPVLSLLVCAWIRSEGQAIVTSAIAVALMASSVVGLSVAYGQSRTDHPFSAFGDHSPLPRDFGPLIARLDQLGIKRVYASYWIAFRITYETDGRIIAADMRPAALRIKPGWVVVPLPNDPDLHSRHPEYGPIVAKVTAPAFVISKGFDVASTDYGSLESARYKTDQVGAFTVYHRGSLSQGTGVKDPG
jgi:hypothetical protein